MIARPDAAHITEEAIRVRYGETDQMGHAYYGNYALWLEQARGAWCRDRGFTYKQLEALGIMLPCVEFHLKYKAEVKYDDVVKVRIWVAELRRASMRFEYEIVNAESGMVASEGYTWHVTMSAERRRAVSIPEGLREVFELPRGSHAALKL